MTDTPDTDTDDTETALPDPVDAHRAALAGNTTGTGPDDEQDDPVTLYREVMRNRDGRAGGI